MTAKEALKHLHSTDNEEQVDALRKLSTMEAMPELYDITVANLSSADSRVVFFSLDMLIKKYAAQVQRDAELLTPWLLQLLTMGDGPVVDRTIWALSVIGEASINKLIECIASTANEHTKEMCTWALGRNAHIHRHVNLVVRTLRGLLHDINPRIQFVALNALMDMSPLRSFKRLAGDVYEFEPVYTELETTALTLLKTNSDSSEWIERYLELLRNRARPSE